MVLAGGTSRRFGSDKLSQPLGQGTLLASAVRGLPGGVRLLVVGPDLPLAAAQPELTLARWVREVPPGGGPAAAMITGLSAALAEPVDAVLVLPGDAPQAGAAAQQLLDQLRDVAVDAVMARDPNGREQPLQLALRPAAARAMIDLAGPSAGAGASARGLLAGLTPRPLIHPVSAGDAYDIDTPDQLVAWQNRDSATVRQVLAALNELRTRRGRPDRPPVVALDGPRGAGKSTLAVALQLRTDAVIVAVDDYADDWRRLRTEAIAPLIGPGGRWRPPPLVILEGLFSARPELADLVDLAVYVRSEEAVRRAGGEDVDSAGPGPGDCEESFYFDQVRPPSGFDLAVGTNS